MAQAHAHDDHGHDDSHSPRHYVKIWLILLVLLAVSIAGPEVAPAFGSLSVIVMLTTAFGIAFVKAWLVIKHFMHLTVEKPIVGYILIICLMFLVLFFAGVAPDVQNHDGANWTNLAAKAEIQRALAEHEASLAGHATDDHGAKKPKVKDAVAEPAAVAAPAAKTFADMKTDAEKKSWLMKRGQKAYAEATCITCHRSSGEGHGPFPTLVGQAEHMGDCAKTIGIITNGMAEPITIGDKVYEQPMPPATGLSKEDAAAIATYVRNSWGNDYGICTP